MNSGMGWQSEGFGGARGAVYRPFDVVGEGWLWQGQTHGNESLPADTQLRYPRDTTIFIHSLMHSFTFSFS